MVQSTEVPIMYFPADPDDDNWWAFWTAYYEHFSRELNEEEYANSSQILINENSVPKELNLTNS